MNEDRSAACSRGVWLLVHDDGDVSCAGVVRRWRRGGRRRRRHIRAARCRSAVSSRRWQLPRQARLVLLRLDLCLRHKGAVQVDLRGQLPQRDAVQYRLLHGPYPGHVRGVCASELLQGCVHAARRRLHRVRLLRQCDLRQLHGRRDALRRQVHGPNAMPKRMLRPSQRHGRARLLAAAVLRAVAIRLARGVGGR